MTDPESFWVAGMPDELAAIISRLDINRRRAAVTGWIIVGVEGRQRHSDFVNAGGADWTRRLRCQLVMRRLINAASKSNT